MAKTKYYSLKNILGNNAQYNMIIGERSNGKTYSVLKYGLESYAKTGKQMGIIRRWSDDFTGKRGQTMFTALESSGEIAKITGGEWTGVYYYGSRWYLCRWEEGKEMKRITDSKPFAYGFSLTSMEHDKSTSYPDITTVLFDEFLTRSAYIQDEFVLFMNVLSTIIRDRSDVKIFMLGNTVNRYCPYFSEMGLNHVKDQEPGTIDIYHYGQTDLKVAVEYCKPNKDGKQSDLYFSFDNPKLSMITGGSWEIDIYPHLPRKYRPCDVLFRFFIVFNADILECEVISSTEDFFCFIHRKTTPLKNPEEDLIFSPEFSPYPNWTRKITAPVTRTEKKIALLFKKEKVFYQSNEVGEIVRNYLQWCKAN